MLFDFSLTKHSAPYTPKKIAEYEVLARLIYALNLQEF